MVFFEAESEKAFSVASLILERWERIPAAEKAQMRFSVASLKLVRPKWILS